MKKKLTDIYNHLTKTENQILDILNNLLETKKQVISLINNQNNSLNTAKQNEVDTNNNQATDDDLWKAIKEKTKTEENKKLLSELHYLNKKEFAPKKLNLFLTELQKQNNNEKEIKSILETIISFIARRSVCCQSTEISFFNNPIPQNITANLVKTELRKCCPKGNNIKAKLKERSFYNKNKPNDLVRYILTKIELQQQDTIIDFNSISIEHIFPINPDPKWQQELSEEEFDQFKNKYLNTIANLTIIEKEINMELGNKSFSDKKSIYKKSELLINQQISDIKNWNEKNYNKRLNTIESVFFKTFKKI